MTTTPPMLRWATLEDADDLGAIHTDGWVTGYAGLLSDDFLKSLSVDVAQAAWRKRLSVPVEPHLAMRPLVADLEGEVCGFATIGPSFDEGSTLEDREIWDVWVHHSWRGHGIGRALVGHLLSITPERIFVWVLDANTAGKAFYAAMGARPDGAIRRLTRHETTLTDVRWYWPPAPER